MAESFEGEEEYFEADVMFDGESMKSLQDGSDVITGPCVIEKAGSRVLHHLEYIEGLGGDAVL